MVLTGKQSLDYSGGVSAEDNLGIGGYDRIMGPNGQAQYWAPDLAAACRILLGYYEHAYVAPGERFPRRAADERPARPRRPLVPARGAGQRPDTRRRRLLRRRQPGAQAALRHPLGDAGRDRRRPPAARALGGDARRRDRRRLGRPPGRLAGRAARHRVARRSSRHGVIPADGPEQWTSGTLFPRASKKIARAINAASGRRPVVVLANLAGFDGSPESMREWQLEFGAEIGRAVVNFDGPIVFCVVSRYHGGAFVVFSQRLNDELEAVALGGRPRVGHRRRAGRGGRVRARRRADRAAAIRGSPRSTRASTSADGAERQRLRAERAKLWDAVLSEKLGEFAAEFDRRPQRRAGGAHGLGRAGSSRPPSCGRSSSTRSSAGCAARSRHEGSGMARRAGSSRCQADVPAGDGWLGAAERDVLSRPAARAAARGLAARALDREGRRGAFLGLAPERIEVLAAPDGAPEAWVVGRARAPCRSRSATAPAGRSPSWPPRRRSWAATSRSSSRAATPSCATGSPRPSRRCWRRCPDGARDRTVNGLWTAKEAAAKVRREGLRLDVRHAVVDIPPHGPRLAGPARTLGRLHDRRLVAG